MNVVNVTVARGDEWEDIEQLETSTDESKNKAAVSDVSQLTASMNKAAGHVATIAVKDHKLFWSNNVYGFLYDYSNMTIVKALKLIIDFKNKRSILYSVCTGPNGLTIEEAIIRVALMMEGRH